jgi:Asp-tRNA(Asn)/Glu-tRNA(Gln) amidotransferase A subunit family amidase
MHNLQRMTRRDLLNATGATTLLMLLRASTPGTAAAAAFDVTEKNINDLQADMTQGQISSVDLVHAYLQRIAAYDQQGPALNAVLYLNPNAVQMAADLDAERSNKGPRGPLHGIPVLLKDNYETYDMPTTGASLALRGATPAYDAFQVRKLRDAGAVLLGKVNLHELALGLTTHSSLAGQTLNPYDLTRAPGGSSGGSAVAVAANFAAFAMGTDTEGSIRVPSSHNNIVGLRPTAGLSSREGIIPFGHTQDTGGPMAKTVTDIALVLDATVGRDPVDEVTATSAGKIPATYTSALRADALRGARIGVVNQLFGDAPEDEQVGDVVRSALVEMRDHGATLVDVSAADLTDQLANANLLAQELKFYLRDYFQAQPGSFFSTVEGWIDSGLLSTTVEAFFRFVFPIWTQPENYLSSDDYRNRLAARQTLAATLTSLMDDSKLDALAYPITRRIAPLLGDNQLGSNAAVSAHSGFPAMNVPAGFTASGFPVGIELLGRAFAEPTLLGLAYSFEQASHHRRLPQTTPAALPSLGSAVEPSADTGPDSITGTLTATGAQAIPPTDVPFQAQIAWSFNDATRAFGYDITVSGDGQDVAGAYLHRRLGEGPRGGIAHVLSKTGAGHIVGRKTLTSAEADALKAGSLYISLLSGETPLHGARADITFTR